MFILTYVCVLAYMIYKDVVEGWKKSGLRHQKVLILVLSSEMLDKVLNL